MNSFIGRPVVLMNSGDNCAIFTFQFTLKKREEKNNLFCLFVSELQGKLDLMLKEKNQTISELESVRQQLRETKAEVSTRPIY